MNDIIIQDFNLLFTALKGLQRIVDAVKFNITENGLEIYSSRGSTSNGSIARTELSTNAIYSKQPIDFCIDNLGNFNKVLSTIKDVHKDDISTLKISYDKPNLMFKSKKIKMKFQTCKEDIISAFISKKVQTQMQSVFQFQTSSELIKLINSHSFLFSDPASIKIYLETKDDMEANSVFATLGNKKVDISNQITLKAGIVTNGKIPDDRQIIIDLERLNLFNCFQTLDQIDIDLMNFNCLLCKIKQSGSNNTYMSMSIYCSMLKDI